MESSKNFKQNNPKYSFCTLMTKPQQYDEMLESLKRMGFDSNNSEFIVIDNSLENSKDGYQGVNYFLGKATGEYVILCHQDLIFLEPESNLSQKLDALNSQDSYWSIAGNAGASDVKDYALYLTHADDRFESRGAPFPKKVHSLDENFLIVKNGLGLRASDDMSGFHLYATDLCFQSLLKGFNAYVIDYNLKHLGTGTMDKSFFDCQRNFVNKYSALVNDMAVQTPCTRFYLSKNPLKRFFLNTKIGLFFVKELGKLRLKSRE